MDITAVNNTEQSKKEYTKPKLENLGHMAQVTQKSGVNFDAQNLGRPKPGGGQG